MDPSHRLLWQGSAGAAVAAGAFAVAVALPALSPVALVVSLSAFILGLVLVEGSLMRAVERSGGRAPAFGFPEAGPVDHVLSPRRAAVIDHVRDLPS